VDAISYDRTFILALTAELKVIMRTNVNTQEFAAACGGEG
jgi:hypothetical protein